ncbi:YraN family protein [Nocardioides acrostichi]|uniref:UPF0102 protein ISG29_02095 n=1 Tax=Nocardioides acrostichi TaxID=2784339 RepID=A0A930Y615_9ACTN|nr:YraN family protein [Nocardioides acrostichi]MBF4160462.1 YraN family protein [Nocardioides acrostichi]
MTRSTTQQTHPPAPADPNHRTAVRPTARQALGAYGERVAAAHLVEQGLSVLDRNWHGEAGEIDLVLRDGDALVVCEVKTRSGEVGGEPHEAVTPVKVDRMRALAEEWQVARGLRAPEVRLDLVAVWQSGRGAARLEHVRGLI